MSTWTEERHLELLKNLNTLADVVTKQQDRIEALEDALKKIKKVKEEEEWR